MRIDTKNLILVGLFSALIGIGAFIKIPVPFVPFTLQFLFTTLAGLLLGPKNGGISVIIYIFIGLMGLPIFASGGGIGYIFNPTFGYLIGFVVGSYLTGKIAFAKKNPSFKRLICACFLGLLSVYICGMIYYYFITKFYFNSPIGIWSLFLYCFVLPVPGDIVICFLSAVIAKRMPPIIRKDL